MLTSLIRSIHLRRMPFRRQWEIHNSAMRTQLIALLIDTMSTGMERHTKLCPVFRINHPATAFIVHRDFSYLLLALVPGMKQRAKHTTDRSFSHSMLGSSILVLYRNHNHVAPVFRLHNATWHQMFSITAFHLMRRQSKTPGRVL